MLNISGAPSTPVSVTVAEPIGELVTYRASMSLGPIWTSSNVMLYLAFGTNENNRPGIKTRELSGLFN